MRVPDRNRRIDIGIYKENLVTEVAIPVEGLGGPGGEYTLLLQRPGESATYPVVSRVDGDTIIWTVMEADTEKPGTGRLTPRWDGPNGEVGKRADYIVRVLESTPDPTSPPEGPFTGYVHQMAGYAQTAREAADRAEALEEGFTAARDQAVEAAAAAKNSETAAGKSAQEAKEDAQRAETAADRADQEMEKRGWMFVQGEEDGHLYLYSNNLENTTLEDDNGRLILVYGD